MSGLHVLFGSDDVVSQWITGDILSGSGFRVTSVCRGSQMLELLAVEAEFDVLIADVTLFDTLPAADLAGLWRRTAIGRPAIYTGSHRTMLSYPLQRAEFFLKTPYSASKLLETIDRAIEEAAFGAFLPAMAGAASHVH